MVELEQTVTNQAAEKQAVNKLQTERTSQLGRNPAWFDLMSTEQKIAECKMPCMNGNVCQ